MYECSSFVVAVVSAAKRRSSDGAPRSRGRTEHDQTKVQEQQRRQQRHHLLHAVIARGRDERAQDAQRQSEDGDTGAEGSQRSSFLSEEHLDFAKDDIVSRWQFVGFLIHLLFNLIDSAQNSAKNPTCRVRRRRFQCIRGLHHKRLMMHACEPS
jgi:hypothetical protein